MPSSTRASNAGSRGRNCGRTWTAPLYEAKRAERQYQTVEPENRLVARTLEARWEAALEQQRAAQDAFDRFQREKPVELTAAERRSLEELSRDIPALVERAGNDRTRAAGDRALPDRARRDCRERGGATG